jgi:hypothetical protein
VAVWVRFGRGPTCLVHLHVFKFPRKGRVHGIVVTFLFFWLQRDMTTRVKGRKRENSIEGFERAFSFLGTYERV